MSRGRMNPASRGRRSYSTQVRQYSFRLVRPRHHNHGRALTIFVLVDDLGGERREDLPMLSPKLCGQMLRALDLVTLAAGQVQFQNSLYGH